MAPDGRASEVAELTAALVRIDSRSPELATDGPGEGAIAEHVAGWLRTAGLEVSVEEAAPGRPNVIGVARGSGGGRTLMLNAHMDTVGVSGMDESFSGRVEGGRVYGRGALDMKGSLAACMIAAARASQLDLRGDVVVTAVADEEVASVGTEAIVRAHHADAAIVTEPTEERLVVAHRGFAGFAIQLRGVAAHGSRPDLGVDAIAHMGPVLTRLQELDRRLQAAHGHPLLGTGSVHASLIEGGQEYSSYPASCRLIGERRTIPGETDDLVRSEVAALLGDADGSWELLMSRPPLETEAGSEIARLVARHAGDPDVTGAMFWADSALLHEAGIPTVLFGPCGEGLHAEVEWVEIASLERCIDVYVAVAAELCA
jgi:acetylornithine deacetylase/succinyl-diaminopimelate desuccinylase-like protein